MIEQILGPEYPRSLRVRRGLARWTGEAGDPAAARDQLAVLLPMIERLLARSTRTPLPPGTNSPSGPEERMAPLAPA